MSKHQLISSYLLGELIIQQRLERPSEAKSLNYDGVCKATLGFDVSAKYQGNK